MKIKSLLRFYFSAEKLNAFLDETIISKASNPYADARKNSEIISAIVNEKAELARLWKYLDETMQGLAKDEINFLEDYAKLRVGVKRLDRGRCLAIRRSAVKFTRHCRRLLSFSEGLKLIGKYYCLM